MTTEKTQALLDYQRDGYLIVPALFTQDEVEQLREHYMMLRKQGEYPGDFAGIDLSSSDPLKQFPRMIHMHRWDAVSRRWLIDQRLNRWLTALMGVEPYAVQTMLYFKPPGARGQALHQDQYYLRVQPGTCMAAWLALDACDEQNGCMQVVPQSHTLPLLCSIEADTAQSFTDVTVPLPAGMTTAPMIMNAGDVLFFNGQLIHGSTPNTSTDRFRRALIGHYIVGDAQKVSAFYHPSLRMDGSEITLETSPDGGACGVWVEQEGKSVVEMVGVRADGQKTCE